MNTHDTMHHIHIQSFTHAGDSNPENLREYHANFIILERHLYIFKFYKNIFIYFKKINDENFKI